MMSVDEEIELLAADIATSRTVRLSDPNALTEVANAQRFLELNSENIVFVSETGAWYVWDGRRWKPDSFRTVFQMAVTYAESLHEVLPFNSESLRFIKRTNSKAGLDALIRIAQNLHNCSISAFDTNPYHLNFLNGTLDLRTGELHDHYREVKITRLINCKYVPNADCSFFDTFLKTIQPDMRMRKYIQRVVGYAMLGHVPERAFFVFHGSGNNGKSVFTNLLLELMGEYACAGSASTLMTGRRGSSPSNDIARLRGKQLVVVPETAEDGKIDAALIKSLSGGDIVTARPLYKEFEDFQFSAKIWIVTNHLPAVNLE